MALRRSIAVAISLQCSPTLRQELVGKVVLFTFQQHIHVLPELIRLRQVMFSSCSPYLDTTMKLDPHGDKITCPALGLYSSPAEYFTMGHVVLDLTSLEHQPVTKSRERSAHPRRHVSFALSEQKSANPAHTRDLENEDDEPLVHRDHTAVSDDEDDQSLVQPASRKELVKEKCDPAADHRNPAAVRRRKGPPVWQDPTVTLEQDVSGNSRERSDEVSIFGQKARR